MVAMPQLSETQAVTRLLDRYAFSATPVERERAQQAGFRQTLTTLLTPSGDDPGAAATPPPTLQPTPKRDRNDQDSKLAYAKVQQTNRTALIRWWLARMVAAEHQGVEKLTWFWHGHFATSFAKVRPVALMLPQNETFRRNALGDFPTLAKEMLTDPAMIDWLDGEKSTLKAPNENLAREFMELFTLGVGQYSEQDVREAARALTGWVITGERAVLQPKRQDRKPKTILGRTGNFDAAGFADVVLQKPAWTTFVPQRLWFRLVGDHPIPDDVLADLPRTFGSGSVASVLTAMASGPAFRDDRHALVKSPVEWLVGLLRVLGVRPQDWSDDDLAKVQRALRAMGQVPFTPPSVGGWPSDQLWLNTGTAVARATLADLVAARAGFVKEAAKASADARISLLATTFGVTWTERTRAALRQADRPQAMLVTAACSPEVVVSR